MPSRKQLKEYFLFSRNDRIAVITLLLLIGLAWSLPYIFAPSPPVAGQDSAWIRVVEEMTKPVDGGPYRQSGQQARQNSHKNSGDRYNNAERGKRFTFDPNTLGSDGWRELGLRDRTIETILKYRSRGGVFRQPADLQKVYGIHPDLAERLVPLVRIAPAKALAKPASHSRPEYRKKEYAVVDLNMADTGALVALPCIGSKLALRIIQFRDKLGGFHSVDQVREVYGITDSSFSVLRPILRADAAACRMIAINQVTVDELKLHPYVRYDLARTIVAYRQEHGQFRELGELTRITALSSAAFEKIRPYLRL